jgi:hypothetical protein
MPDVVDGHITAREAEREAVQPAGGWGERMPVVPARPRTGHEAEAGARQTLRGQIAKLERELASLFASAYPRKGLDWGVSAPGGPRVLGVGELEELRDALADRVEEARQALRERREVERHNVARIDEMIAEPARFKWVRISNADIGEPGCKYWHSRPRLGLIGMLMGWWRVKISSGCP